MALPVENSQNLQKVLWLFACFESIYKILNSVQLLGDVSCHKQLSLLRTVQ